MKAIRTYGFDAENKIFSQRSVFLPDDDSLDDPMECLCQALVSPTLPGDKIDGGVLTLLVKDSEFPLDLRIQELNHFLTLLQYMYQYGS